MKNDIFKIDDKTKYQILLWLIGGLVLVFATEFFLRGSLYEVWEFFIKTPGVVLVNYLLILILTSIFFFTKRKYLVYFLLFLAILGVSASTFFLMNARGMPFMFSDLCTLREAMAIANNYVSKTMIIIAVLCVAFLAIVAVFLYRLNFDTKRFKLINFVLIFVVCVCFFSTLKIQSSLNIMKLNKANITESYECNGFVYSTVESALEYIRTKPSDYSKKNIDKIKEKVDKATA